MPSFAANCPDIPATITKVTVKYNDATLRKEPKQGELDKNRPTIIADDLLKVLDNKPTENEKHCWYKVNPVRNKNQDQEWWIAGNVGLKEFSSWQEDPKPLPSPRLLVTSTSSPDPRGSKYDKGKAGQKEQAVSPLLWLAIALGGVGTLGSIGTLIFCVLRFSKQEEALIRIPQIIEPTLNKVSTKIDQYTKSIHKLNERSLKTKEIFKEIGEQIQLLEQKQSGSIGQNQVSAPVATNAVTQFPVAVFETPAKKSMTDEMVENFNSQNRDYFRDGRFQPLTLTQQSIQKQVGLNPRRIVQLEAPSDSSQASYLTTEIDRENWLIPNITSPYISQIMRNLHENPEIFVVESGSETLRLIKPAKLKSVSSGLWEIEEPGEFSNGKISKIEPKTVLPQPLTKPVDIEKASTLDLPIILYLRKNGDTNLTDLLNNFQCDQEQLKERLIALQQEELINLIKQNDPNNSLYQLR